MRLRKLTRQEALLIILLLVLVLNFGFMVHLRRTASRDNLSPTPRSTVPTKRAAILPETVNAGVPVRIRIPRINVDSALEHTGLTLDGDLAAPSGPTDAAWYDQGPRPGDSGNAIINGHYGYRDDIPAVFDRLQELRSGDTIYVEDDQGVSTTFVVRTSRTYTPDEDATDVFRPTDGRSHLNLITCQGSWSRTDQSYSTRLVVFADKQGS